MNPKVIVKMKAMHPLKNHQKHTSLPHQRLKKKGTQITEDLLDSNHYYDHNKDETDLKTRNCHSDYQQTNLRNQQ